MKNKKYEGSVDAANKMPFMSEKLDNNIKNLSASGEEENTNKIIELEDRIIEIHDK
ncbi:hypothetical protein [Clostridium sp. DJ247]|uniref:hypothetical protein n=1 Tax=Clostridium sp. DJ247 TaxID=2726188 RepID=UPI00162A5168|nr:hypothetical protein [Clostridium sp. DJ247]MBC2582603.1 hypothetical protein [Clostridium sp. DJ247]